MHLSYCCELIALVIGHAAGPSLGVLLLLCEVCLLDVSILSIRRPLRDYRLTPLDFKPVQVATCLIKLILISRLEFRQVGRLVSHPHIGGHIPVLLSMLLL